MAETLTKQIKHSTALWTWAIVVWQTSLTLHAINNTNNWSANLLQYVSIMSSYWSLYWGNRFPAVINLCGWWLSTQNFHLVLKVFVLQRITEWIHATSQVTHENRKGIKLIVKRVKNLDINKKEIRYVPHPAQNEKDREKYKGLEDIHFGLVHCRLSFGVLTKFIRLCSISQ